MTVRTAKAEDYAALASIQRRSVETLLRPLYDAVAIDNWLRVIDEEKFKRVARTGETILVACSQKGILGFASYHPEMSLLGMWYVDPGFVGQGVGRVLLIAAENGLLEAGCVEATTEASLYARPHFESRGWKVDEEFDKHAFGGVFRVARMSKALQPG